MKLNKKRKDMEIMSDLPKKDFTKQISISVFDAKMILANLEVTKSLCEKHKEFFSQNLIQSDINLIKNKLNL